ncbi:MAG: hypothetical protein OXU94_04230 [Gammaproteobacteria bacterium]|nr:hypothetical protein [Gammaproteobacteria bacterium]
MKTPLSLVVFEFCHVMRAHGCLKCILRINIGFDGKNATVIGSFAMHFPLKIRERKINGGRRAKIHCDQILRAKAGETPAVPAITATDFVGGADMSRANF